MTSPSPKAFRHRNYLLFWFAKLFATFGVQIGAVSVGWLVYDITHDPFYLGLVGLIQFVPALALVLLTGSVADRYSRKYIVMCTATVELAVVVCLLFMVLTGATNVFVILGLMLLSGIGRAFQGPAAQAIMGNLVPVEALADAVAWNSSSWQLATILGPVAGGLLYGLGAAVPFAVAVFMFLAAITMLSLIRITQQIARSSAKSWTDVVEGFRYVWSKQILLGAISLDLFAVLLGGAIALLPAVASDVLAAGPVGLGLLRAGPGIGAIATVLVISRYPVRSSAGAIMFICVGIFGLATAVFGLSHFVWLSVLALATAGAADMVSVYIRETLIQLATPDELRGRVAAVNMVFVGASNELGEFRAGTMASWIGVVPAIVVGGIGSMLVAGLWSRMFPQLRKADRVDRI